jgi:hypothetical protein
MATMSPEVMRVMAIAQVLKQRFQNLGVQETIEIAGRILVALDEVGKE